MGLAVKIDITPSAIILTGTVPTVQMTAVPKDHTDTPTADTPYFYSLNTAVATVDSTTGLVTRVGDGVPAIKATLQAPIGAGATHFVLTAQPGGASDGVALTQQPVVEARKADNTLDTGYTGTVTASVASGTSTLGGTVAVAAVAGVVTFAGLSLSGVDTDTLRFSDGVLTDAVSGNVVVSAFTPLSEPAYDPALHDLIFDLPDTVVDFTSAIAAGLRATNDSTSQDTDTEAGGSCLVDFGPDGVKPALLLRFSGKNPTNGSGQEGHSWNISSVILGAYSNLARHGRALYVEYMFKFVARDTGVVNPGAYALDEDGTRAVALKGLEFWFSDDRPQAMMEQFFGRPSEPDYGGVNLAGAGIHSIANALQNGGGVFAGHNVSQLTPPWPKDVQGTWVRRKHKLEMRSATGTLRTGPGYSRSGGGGPPDYKGDYSIGIGAHADVSAGLGAISLDLYSGQAITGTVNAGDTFTIISDPDTVKTVYTVTGGPYTAAANSLGTVAFTPNLVHAVTAGDALNLSSIHHGESLDGTMIQWDNGVPVSVVHNSVMGVANPDTDALFGGLLNYCEVENMQALGVHDANGVEKLSFASVNIDSPNAFDLYYAGIKVYADKAP